MRLVQIAAAAVGCVLVAASVPAEARGRGFRIGSSRTVYVSGHLRASGSSVAPYYRSRNAVGPTATSRGERAGAYADVRPRAPDDAEIAGVPLAAAQRVTATQPPCPAERLVGSGAGFCEIN